MRPRAARPPRLHLLVLSGGLALAITATTGLVGGWGRWYSHDLSYRRQTEAFFRGEIALSHNPRAMSFDMAWAQGGVQQVWGLGVPAWRFVGELAARAVGLPAFPDRLALALAIALAAYLVFAAFLPHTPCPHAAQGMAVALVEPERVVAAAFVILFPPVLTLCSGQFNVYEEPVVYGYYYSISLFSLVLEFAREPGIARAAAIGVLGGLIGFVRPTLFVYGIAAATTTALVARSANWTWRRSAAVFLFVALGGLALLGSNRNRFGAGLEFGHNLNFTGRDIMFACRFGSPFDDQSFWQRGRELVGALFFVNRLSRPENFEADAVRWQMPVERWRNFYSRTYDASYLLILSASILLIVGHATVSRRLPGRLWTLPTLACFWAITGVTPLVVFYTGYYSLSSRYMLDFAPGLACAAVALLTGATQIFATWRVGRVAQIFLVAGFLLWWAVEVLCGETTKPSTPAWPRTHVLDELTQLPTSPVIIPKSYQLGDDYPWASGILHNGLGWNSATGQTGAFVSLFVENPNELQVEVEPVNASDAPYLGDIRVRIGLELLAVKSAEKTYHGYKLIFAPPRRIACRRGVQVVFIAFVSSAEFQERSSPWRLTRVTW